MVISKIDAMHKRFGKVEGKRCGDCCHLIERVYNNKYFKCEIYGLSRSTATDWAKKWVACGIWNKESEPNEGRAMYVREKDDKPMEGQISIGEVQNDD